jgi:predicted DNA-binding transcriptional regulator AlpA
MTTTADKGLATRQKSYDLLLAKVEGGQSLTPTEITSMTRFEAELAAAGLDVPDNFVAIAQVEHYTGYKSRTIYNAVKSGDLFRKSDNSFARADIDAWLRVKGRQPNIGKNLVDELQDEDDENSSADQKFSSKNEEAKFRHFRARREQILVQQLEGQLLPRQLVEEQQISRAHEFKTAILLLSRRVAHRIAAVAGVDTRLVTEIMDEEGKQLLSALCRKIDLHVD